jgi:hypothetical protein
MSECKPSQKNGPVSQSGLSSISKVLNLLLSAFNLPRKPTPKIPPFLLLIGAELRPGMSARELSASIISRMESEAGIPMGDIFGDGPNGVKSLMLIQAEEQVSHIQTKAKVSSVIKPGSVQITAVGGNAGGPIVVQGSNTSITESSGIMS